MNRRYFIFALALAFSTIGLASQNLVADDSHTIQIATYNIRYASPRDGEDIWPNRKESVAKYVRQNDIIGLQEVTEPQFSFLKQELGEFDSYGVGRDDGKSGGEHAPIFFRKDRFEVLDKGTFWLSETPEEVGKKGWDAALPRTCTWIVFRDKQVMKPLLVANTHFDHRGVKARTESGRLLARRANELPDDLPVILLGDFNCLPDSEPHQAIVESLSDARGVSRSKPTGPNSTWNGFKAIVPDRIIDHVFVRSATVDSIRVADPKTASGRFASDHLPVEAAIRIKLDD